MTVPALEVRALRVAFPGRRATLRALDDVSFSVAPGEILGVVGESGAGKSLTGAAIVGLLQPPGRIVGGEVILQGERIDNLEPAALRAIRGRRIGSIFQDPLNPARRPRRARCHRAGSAATPARPSATASTCRRRRSSDGRGRRSCRCKPPGRAARTVLADGWDGRRSRGADYASMTAGVVGPRTGRPTQAS